MTSEEIKNEFVNCIEGSYTINLAISVLEERDLYKAIINKAIEYIKELKSNCDEKCFDTLLKILGDKNE